MSLTVTAVRNLRPQAKPQKLFDEGGLFLLVSPAGGKWWRLKYRYAGREKLLSLGTFPEIGLKDARERRDEAPRQLASNIDPGEHRKATKTATLSAAANSFEVVAREWIGKYKPTWLRRMKARSRRGRSRTGASDVSPKRFSIKR